ncbi:MAG: poly-gamma-glutamate hydrolase family protein [Desulfobacterales bacterium]|nr:MAG: poly-gamma-glutamate hydrolase family protein [Desulfobacterales bacterium]
MDNYKSFHELNKTEKAGRDYRIQWRIGNSGIAIMAPHGGEIEPGTTEIADAIAGGQHSFYSFEGLKSQGNLKLHIPSSKFDEPVGIDIARQSRKVLTVHGCRDPKAIVHIGGKDSGLKAKIKAGLRRAGFAVLESRRYAGMHSNNICNRSRTGQGVQLEISLGLRRQMFPALARRRRQRVTLTFHQLAAAVKQALCEG